MRLIITKQLKIIYSMYRAGEVSVHRACCERAIQLCSLVGGTIYPGPRPAGVTTRSPRMVTQCLHTRSMLNKNCLPLHGMCLYMYILFTVSQFHAHVHSVYLVFQIAKNVLSYTTILSERVGQGWVAASSRVG